MTQLLERAFTKASQLSTEEQDTIAALILKEIEAEQRWEEAFASSQDVLAQLADEALAEHQGGRTKKLNVDEL
ncbi:MAG: hypothetical protein WAM82_14150 [Thermoanaerobaculia bacterium]